MTVRTDADREWAIAFLTMATGVRYGDTAPVVGWLAQARVEGREIERREWLRELNLRGLTATSVNIAAAIRAGEV